jgi:hypothetical protein
MTSAVVSSALVTAGRSHRGRAVVLLLAFAIGASGCHTIHNMLPSARQAAATKEKLVQLEARARRFADEYVGRLLEDTAALRREHDNPKMRPIVAAWMLTQANAAYSNASGPSPVLNALDLVTLAVLSRMVIEDTVVPLVPEAGSQLLETHRHLEAQAWKMCEEFLTPSQIGEFRAVLAEWRVRNPHVSGVAFIHFMDFAKAIGRPRPGETASSAGLFGMLGLDPLAGLDPAVKQIEQTRQFAERTIFYMQRVPYIVNLQLSSVTSELLARPESRDLLRDATRVSESVARFSRVAAALPLQISAEREALVGQLSLEMLNHEAALRPLIVDLRASLEAGSAAADSLDSMVQSLDALMARFPARPVGASGAGDEGRPFDITEYTVAARELASTAVELRQLIGSLDEQSPNVAATLDRTVSQARSLIDFLFWRAAALIVLLTGAVLAAALIWRRVSRPPPADG